MAKKPQTSKSTKPRSKARKTPRLRSRLVRLLPRTPKQLEAAKAELRKDMLLASIDAPLQDDGKELGLHSGILELRSLPFSQREFECLVESVEAEAEAIERSGGIGIRFRIEATAAGICELIYHVHELCDAVGPEDKEAMTAVMIDLAIARAKEMWSQDGA